MIFKLRSCGSSTLPFFVLLVLQSFILSCTNPLNMVVLDRDVRAVSPVIKVEKLDAYGNSVDVKNGDIISMLDCLPSGSRSLTLKIGNTGTSALKIAQGAFSIQAGNGTESSAFSQSLSEALTLESGETATVVLTFNPATVGEKNATLSLKSNDYVTPVCKLSLKGTCVQIDKPATPANFLVEKSSNTDGSQYTTLNLTWSSSERASSYEIQRAGDTLFNNVIGWSGLTGNLFSDTTVVPGKTYYYRIRAVNAGGPSEYSPAGATDTVKTLDGVAVATLSLSGGIEVMEAGSDMTFTPVFNNGSSDPSIKKMRWTSSPASVVKFKDGGNLVDSIDAEKPTITQVGHGENVVITAISLDNTNVSQSYTILKVYPVTIAFNWGDFKGDKGSGMPTNINLMSVSDDYVWPTSIPGVQNYNGISFAFWCAAIDGSGEKFLYDRPVSLALGRTDLYAYWTANDMINENFFSNQTWAFVTNNASYDTPAGQGLYFNAVGGSSSWITAAQTTLLSSFEFLEDGVNQSEFTVGVGTTVRQYDTATAYQVSTKLELLDENDLVLATKNVTCTKSAGMDQTEITSLCTLKNPNIAGQPLKKVRVTITAKGQGYIPYCGLGMGYTSDSFDY